MFNRGEVEVNAYKRVVEVDGKQYEITYVDIGDDVRKINNSNVSIGWLKSDGVVNGYDRVIVELRRPVVDISERTHLVDGGLTGIVEHSFHGIPKQVAQQDYDKIGELMDKNFDLRRKIFGDKVIGEKNLQMIEIARSQGCPAKFSGSGGTIIGMYHNQEEFRRLAKIYPEHGFNFAKVAIDRAG